VWFAIEPVGALKGVADSEIASDSAPPLGIRPQQPIVAVVDDDGQGSYRLSPDLDVLQVTPEIR
jgi:hypothetical protein